jgi:hypothetical protein
MKTISSGASRTMVSSVCTFREGQVRLYAENISLMFSPLCIFKSQQTFYSSTARHRSKLELKLKMMKIRPIKTVHLMGPCSPKQATRTRPMIESADGTARQPAAALK